ncbi:MAG: DUF697 domain-containing protein [SAR324 cluster bacterium]|nr:DUF697 domain-containing protein [SAR324 cluster bacterium]
MSAICPSISKIAAFAEGKGEGEEHRSLVYHVNRCESCYHVLSEILYAQKQFPGLIPDIDSEIWEQIPDTESSAAAVDPYSKGRHLQVLKEASRKDIQGTVIIKNNVLFAIGTGLIPIPLLDILGTSAIQLKMLNQLSSLYQIPFSKHLGKSLIGILLGGLGVSGLSRTGWSFAKLFPGLGMAGGIVMMPLATGASTYAVGKIFHQHFALGGTFLDFNPKTVKNHFSDLYSEGHTIVSKINSENSKSHFQIA